LGESETDVEVFIHVGRSGIDKPPPGERHKLLVGQPGRQQPSQREWLQPEERLLKFLIVVSHFQFFFKFRDLVFKCTKKVFILKIGLELQFLGGCFCRGWLGGSSEPQVGTPHCPHGIINIDYKQ
jgi:hypothetical protein